MKLNYKIQGSGQPVILLHGLFGSMDNLGVIGRALMDDFQVIQVDLRNHGFSPWSDDMNYILMAQDIQSLITLLSLQNVIIIGHSMGGKVAMRLTELLPDRIKVLIVLDIAPVSYTSDSHRQVFQAINACTSYVDGKQQPNDRKSVQAIMSHYLNFSTIQFLLKSYKSEHWLFNFQAIEQHYGDICSWQQITPYYHSTLFIRGGNSNYIQSDYYTDILNQFPYSVIETIEGAGHNVHNEKPEQVISLIKQWIMQK